ncbi:dihydrofolate reductase family protein [uncultured Friedmanniella sp.]|uniref:dihydrofolate reductase family protein n=1 Tax=uncultured Friedmanniella sp. TaxID=335381 RepID=UPI0035C9D246
MARLIYAGITSLDGYVADADGSFAWAMPDAEVHAFVNDTQRGIGTHLYGRRMYEVLSAWETMDVVDEPAVMQDYAQLWRAADKIVYSTTLPDVTTSRTSLMRVFDVDAVRKLKQDSDLDLLVGGPGLAATAVREGLVDEIRQLLVPVIVGGGTPFLPAALKLTLELVDERRFAHGTVALAYAVRGDG